MKTLGIILTMVIVATLVYCVNVEATPTIDRSATVAASGTVAAVTSMSITAPSPAILTYGTTSSDAYPTTPANAKIVISYTSNYNPWKMRVYTNNTQVPMYGALNNAGVQIGRYAKGGLATAATSDGVNIVPCKWVAKDGANATVPAIPTWNTYNFVKDIRDEDDPATTGANKDESWAASSAAGYANIAYGGPGGAFCVDPTNSASGPTQYQGQAITSSSIALYVAAAFGTSFGTNTAGTASQPVPAAAGSYSTSFTIELYHE